MTTIELQRISQMGLKMISRRSIIVGSVFVLSAVIGEYDAVAQQAEEATGTATVRDPSTQEQTEFAPGVLTVIPPAPLPKETFDGPLTLQTLIDNHPEIRWGGDSHPEGRPHFDPRSRMLTEMAEEVFLRREIYGFEFAFKPLRQIYLDVPRPDGRMQRKLIWYMVFRIRYLGGDLRPAADQIGGKDIYERIESVSYASRRIFPMLVLNNRVTDKRYVDRILPTAKEKIAIREQISAPLHNTVEISRVDILRTTDPAAPGIWGIATWEDVDPKLDFFSVDVFGLTNAFEQDGEGPDAPYRRKALQLNFYRPGDAIKPLEDTIRFGVPAFENQAEQDYVLKQYGIDQRLDYQWIFR